MLYGIFWKVIIAVLSSVISSVQSTQIFNMEVTLFVFIFIYFNDFRYINIFVSMSPDPCRRGRSEHSAHHCAVKEPHEGKTEFAGPATV